MLEKRELDTENLIGKVFKFAHFPFDIRAKVGRAGQFEVRPPGNQVHIRPCKGAPSSGGDLRGDLYLSKMIDHVSKM